MRLVPALVLSTAALWCALPAQAETSWEFLQGELYGTRPLTPAGEAIALEVPYRTDNDARTRVAATIAPPQGLSVAKAWVILDDNPMPVSAVFELAHPQPRFRFDLTLRINGPMPLHVVVETTDGQLFVAEAFVKTSGQGACSAPPGTDPALALAHLGEITIDVLPPARTASERLAALAGPSDMQLDVDIRHPSHSGLQMDQITLLFIPMRYISDVDITLDGGEFVEITGSISLSENPRLGLGVPKGTQSVGVTMTDTEGTTTHAEKRLPGY